MKTFANLSLLRTGVTLDSSRALRMYRLVRIVTNHLYRPEQAGGQQRRVPLVRLYVGKGLLRGSRLFVSDQPIHPRVNNLYPDLVRTGFDKVRDRLQTDFDVSAPPFYAIHGEKEMIFARFRNALQLRARSCRLPRSNLDPPLPEPPLD